jgi:hypothetical protein
MWVPLKPLMPGQREVPQRQAAGDRGPRQAGADDRMDLDGGLRHGSRHDRVLSKSRYPFDDELDFQSLIYEL